MAGLRHSLRSDGHALAPSFESVNNEGCGKWLDTFLSKRLRDSCFWMPFAAGPFREKISLQSRGIVKNVRPRLHDHAP